MFTELVRFVIAVQLYTTAFSCWGDVPSNTVPVPLYPHLFFAQQVLTRAIWTVWPFQKVLDHFGHGFVDFLDPQNNCETSLNVKASELGLGLGLGLVLWGGICLSCSVYKQTAKYSAWSVVYQQKLKGIIVPEKKP